MPPSWKTQWSSCVSEWNNLRMTIWLWILSLERSRARRRESIRWMRSWTKHWRERIWRLRRSRRSIRRRWARSAITATTNWSYLWIWAIVLTRYIWLLRWMTTKVSRGRGVRQFTRKGMIMRTISVLSIRVSTTSSTRFRKRMMMIMKYLISTKEIYWITCWSRSPIPKRRAIK